ncbi:MAG: TetR/AcrR family transcriptional regulator [Dyadobacter fermentans]
MLLEKNTIFTLEEVAKELNISRATIYRYYSNVDMLCAEATLSLRVKQQEDFLEDVKDMTLKDSLVYVQKYFNMLAYVHETGFRKYLSVVLDESVKKGSAAPLRGARRPAALDAVMRRHADRIGPENYIRLKQIVTTLSGVEPMIANKDVNGLSNEQSDELLEWAVTMILKGLSLEG